MKRYSYGTRRFIDTSTALMVGDKDRVKIESYKDELDVLISSNEFIEKFRVYVDDIAKFKRVDGRKFMRPTDYAAIGILDSNDLYQEAYLAFLEAYNNLDWKKVDEVHEDERGAIVWGFLKQSTVQKFEKNLRAAKDGIRVPEREMFDFADSPNKLGKSANTNFLTKLFSRLEVAFANNVEEVAATKYDTDLTGYFLEVHMDEFLDLTRAGNRDFKKNERAVIKALFGIDQVKMSYKELSEYYQIGESTIRKVKERAIKRLQSEESKQLIADFLHEYRIPTGADIEGFKK